MQPIHLTDSFSISARGLVVTGKPLVGEWIQAGAQLRQYEATVQFAIGDWLGYGERRYGEMYAQGMVDTGLAYGTLANLARVARNIESSRRHENLSFSHHSAVAGLPPDAQDEILDMAGRHQMSRDDVRDEVRSRQVDSDDAPSEVCPVCHGAGYVVRTHT